MLFVMP